MDVIISRNYSAEKCNMPLLCPTVTVARAGSYYTFHDNTSTMLGNDKKMKYRDRIWVKRACSVRLFSYAHGENSMAVTENEKGESRSLNETDEPELVCKNGATSVVWNWFGFRPSDTQQNTTNLFHHLKQKHLLEYNKAVKAREEASASTSVVVRPKKLTQQTIGIALNSCTSYDKSKHLFLEYLYGFPRKKRCMQWKMQIGPLYIGKYLLKGLWVCPSSREEVRFHLKGYDD
ncbi:uncharacterized protein LOC120526071 [Polypterus senegalus]|uniref:uncharacterized protein LOC120526071 n=1 Tax=Polypterus senegalus TaxID=55291 RepID=UPI0019653AC9|nr:uncharacterized protein LOC120526071 [Polypterus senegalus]